MRRSVLRLCLGAAAAFALPVALGGSASAARPRRAVIEHAAVIPSGDRRLGALPTASPLRGAVVLRPRDEAALTAFVAQVSDPGSPRHGDYLPAGEFAHRFGPTAAARDAVTAALRADGLHVGAPSADGLIVPFSGATGDVERAFRTSISDVALPGGAHGRATSAPVTLPSDVAGSVAAVVGLDDTVLPHRIATPDDPGAARPAVARLSGADAASRAVASTGNGPHACPAAATAALKDNGLTDDAIAGAYGASGLYDVGDTGQGEHIAVYELEPFLRSDVRTFDTCYFGAAGATAMQRRLHVVDVDGGPPVGTGSGEASLDVEDLSAIAPGATIDVYVGPAATAYDSLDEYAEIVDRDRDRVVSTSWGLCEQGVQRGQPGEQEAENLLFQQAAAQGQTVFAAAGDSGSDDCSGSSRSGPTAGQDPVSVDDPASQPYVVGVGGTALTDATPGAVAEHAWNDGVAFGAGGGGISESWAMPVWQRAARIAGIARPGDADYRAGDRLSEEAGFQGGFCDATTELPAGTPCRLVPDVSAQADEFTGAVTVYSREYATKRSPTGWSTIGGTSSAAPIWAASMALVDASPECASDAATRGGVGFAAPLLYAVASDPARDAESYTDVRTGDNDVYGLDRGRVYPAGPGYDLATGLGSPILSGVDGGAGLAANLCAAAAGAGRRPAVDAVSPRTAPSRGGTRLTVRGDGFASSGRDRVVAVQVGAQRVTGGRLRVSGSHTITLTLPAARRALPPRSASTGGGPGAADVLVSLADGLTSAPGPHAIVRYLDLDSSSIPTVQAVSPAGGDAGGGTRVTLVGSGFTGATGVSVGGVAIRSFRVVSPNRITFTSPRRSAATRCVALPHREPYRGENAGNDVCQTYVRVRVGHAVSPRSLIRAPAEGPQHLDAEGVIATRPGCDCETAQAPDEFDYAPRPRISSISTDDGPLALASEHGGTLVTVRGSGLDPLTIDYADVGAPGRYASEQTSVIYETGTELLLRAPRRTITAGAARVPFAVRSLAGRSQPRALTYAGVPQITSVVNDSDGRNIAGVYGGPDTGGTAVTVHGRGLGSQVLGIQYVQAKGIPLSLGTQYLFTSHGSRRLTTRTVAENPAVVIVQACSVSGCTRPGGGNRFWLYEAGAPTVTALSPTSGPASGGTAVSVAGQNLGCAVSATFGATPSPTITPVKTLLPCGSSQALTLTAPPGTAGSTVPVTVQTAAGFYTGAAPASAGTFTYR